MTKKSFGKSLRQVNTLLALLFSALLVPTSLFADDRQREELHKEAFFDIRVTENREASNVAAEVANFMKTHEDAVINIIGYADRQTGNAALNVNYARERAENFRNELIGRYGVDPKRVSIDSKGDHVQPFRENSRNRCVIIDGYGYVPTTPPTPATQRAEAQRTAFQEAKTMHYEREMLKNVKDTVYIQRTDTIWVMKADTLKEERPFGLNKANRWNNWFVSLSGGPAIFQGDHNADARWKDRIYPAFDLTFGKWIYPALGVRAGVNLDMIHNYYNAYDPSNDLAAKYGKFVHGASPNEPYKHNNGLFKMRYNAWNFHADVMLNVSSFIWRPYNRRVWNLIPYVGVGCITTWDKGDQDWFNYAFDWNVGVLNSFRVAEHFDINIDLRLKQFSDKFNCFRQGRSMEGTTNLMIGATWYINKRGF